MADAPLILASTSPYRASLLARLQLPFTQCAPDFQELTPDAGLDAEALVRRNALGKAESVWRRHPSARVIASDQLALCGDRVLGKPGSLAAAAGQLAMMAGREVTFLTAVTLFGESELLCDVVPFTVQLRRLTEAEIMHYLRQEQPFDCAGSFKSEGLGIALFERMRGDDPTALIGLPLIRLSGWLKPLQPV